MHLHENDTAEDLYLSFKSGEERGFGYFFHLYFKPLVHYACTFLNDVEAAEDVVEDSFVKLWERRESIESVFAVKPYLYVTTRNACLDVLRREKHSSAYSKHLSASTALQADDGTRHIIISESMHLVYLASQNLPPRCRQVFTMVYVQGKSIKEIASELDLSVSTVKAQKARALALLRKQLPYLGCLLLLVLLQ